MRWVRATSVSAGNTLHRQGGLCSGDSCPQQDYSQALVIRIGESEQVRWEKLIFTSARSCRESVCVPLTKGVSFTTLFSSDRAPVHSTYLTGAAETHLQPSKLMQALISSSLAFPFNFTTIYFCSGTLALMKISSIQNESTILLRL